MTNFADEQEITAASAKNPLSDGQDHPIGTDRLQKRHIGWIVAGSLATGALAALLLAAAPTVLV